MKTHKFTITKNSVCKPLACCVCASLATRRCMGMKIPAECFERLTTLVVESFEDTEHIRVDEFVEKVAGHLQLGDYISLEKTKSLFSDCKGRLDEHRSNTEVWKRFQDHLTSFVEMCDDNFCNACYEDYHKKGRRSKHQWFGFKEGADVCVECEILPATKCCLTCRDNLCTICSSETHARGKKKRHVMEDVRESIEPHQSYCVCCGTRAGLEGCEFCKMPLCHSCKAFKHKGECKVRIKLVGEDDAELECSVCAKVPDTMCEECGDVYSSIKWMGNPGCFKKMHKKGNRVGHTLVPYTFLVERDEKEKQEKEAEVKEIDAEKKLEERGRNMDQMLEEKERIKGEERGRRLAAEAKAEFERRHTIRMVAAAKTGFLNVKLPKIVVVSGALQLNLLAVIKSKINNYGRQDGLVDVDGKKVGKSRGSMVVDARKAKEKAKLSRRKVD